MNMVILQKCYNKDICKVKLIIWNGIWKFCAIKNSENCLFVGFHQKPNRQKLHHLPSLSHNHK